MNLFKQLFGGSPSVDLESLIKDGAFLVDVRTPGEFAGGHAKGSVNIPLDQLPQQLSRLRNKKSIIVCCQSGGRSGQAKGILEKNGITNVINGGNWNNVAQYC
ncbi:rhodanese-like domain-containing protein [Mucilaginibacter sp. P25]|uniref:Rhodanese-related sulfurtransferase n=1 Tax=Mucilaginibacter gossypii TaxID=551996 RepID=A0A1G8LQX3_9SPHI|nr:rhodanese-like domain-containing protein [Mucilaginibacter gossypii]SDI58066.1 Rhodanese-related sulfurtransferase [Mucilaginibacter gossypii]